MDENKTNMKESVVRADHAVALCSKINEYPRDDAYSDIDFRVQEKSFKCHRLVLGAASEYFHVMFTGKFKESKESVVPLEGVTADIFEIVLQFIYTGDVSICPANLYELFHASEYYKLPDLEMMCIQFVRESALPLVEDVSQLYSFFHTTSKEEVTRSLDQNIFDHFDCFYRTPEFLKISIDDLCRILQKKYYRRPTIHDIFHRAIVRWTKYATSHSPEERKGYSKRLVESIDCARLSGQYLEYMTIRWCIEHDGNTVSSTNTEDEIMYSETEKSLVKPSCLHAFVINEGPKRSFIPSFVSSCYNMYNNYKWIPSYNFKNRRLFDFMRTVEANNYLYCLSYVKNPKKENATMESSSQKFITTSSVSLFPESYLTPPPLTLQNFDICKIHGNIYIYNKNAQSNAVRNVENSAKFDEDELSRAVYLYNTETDLWLPVPPLKQKYENACMTSDERMLYLIGGTNSNRYVQGYDHRTPEWTALAPTSGIFERAACCVSKAALYVSGGCQNPRKVEMYNPTAAKWNDESDLRGDLYNHEMLVDEHENCITYNDYVEPDKHVFYIDNNNWSSCMYEDLSQFIDLDESDRLRVIHMAPFKLYGL